MMQSTNGDRGHPGSAVTYTEFDPLLSPSDNNNNNNNNNNNINNNNTTTNNKDESLLSHDKTKDPPAAATMAAFAAAPGGNSSILGCIVNITNAIMGAGCIGYGGAMAASGGLISIVLIVMFAVLTKWSFDLLIDLGLKFHIDDNYEALATRASGTTGRLAVVSAKGIFSFGCMVAYIVILKDNLTAGCRGLLSSTFSSTWWSSFWDQELIITLVISLVGMLPLCLLRDVTPLERFSSAKVVLYGAILAIVVYLYFILPLPTIALVGGGDDDDDMTTKSSKVQEVSHADFMHHWLTVKRGVFESMGTMVLAFVATHTLHMFFRSLAPQHRTLEAWKTVSTASVGISCAIFMGMAVFSYMTYWEKTSSDLFQQYPNDLVLVNVARICLGVAMILTYPMPMFSLRELIAAFFVDLMTDAADDGSSVSSFFTLTQSENNKSFDQEGPPAPRQAQEPAQPQRLTPSSPTALLTQGKSLQQQPQSWESHVVLTVVLWTLSFLLAISAASLGQVLNLIGCISGTLIGFVLPAIFSHQLQGYTRVGTLLLVVGGLVGCIGTWFSLQQIIVG